MYIKSFLINKLFFRTSRGYASFYFSFYKFFFCLGVCDNKKVGNHWSKPLPLLINVAVAKGIQTYSCSTTTPNPGG